jgi:hypothetical protein
MRIAWACMVVGLGLVACGYQAQPPAAPPPVEVPADVKSSLPADAQGRPVLVRTRGAGDGNLSISLVYDEKKDDPITRWASCLERVVACKQANLGHSIKECIPLIARCADDTGGVGCCPGACLDAFQRVSATGLADTEAVRQSFLKGDCVTGLTAFLDDSAVQP